MTLEHLGYIVLPEHIKPGGFDHAAVHRASARLYVAHTANDALDVIDCATDRYLHSIPNLPGVAGTLVSDEHNLVFTSNRGENTIGIFTPGGEAGLVKVAVGIRPNGLAYAPLHNLLLSANVGDPALDGLFTISIVEAEQRAMIADIAVPGRTRWAIYHARQDAFFVNIADPPQIVVIEASAPKRLARTYPIPAAGPHGLDLDLDQDWLFCACDGQKLITLEAGTGEVRAECDLGGAPDVIFFNTALQHLYVAIGDPGVIEVFDTPTLKRIKTVLTEKGAHTIGFDPDRNKVYAFLPQTHRAAVYRDSSGL